MEGKQRRKALLVTHVSGFVPQFEMNNVHILQKMGYEVHYASNFHTPSYGTDNHRLDGTGIICHQIDFVRSPFDKRNFQVYRQMVELMRRENFSLVHCHTPMGGVMARLAAHATGTGPVIYTAHGFHFFKGASWKNWLFYYPMEKFLSRYTDQQICINREDYELAKRKFHARYVDYVPGVGIEEDNFFKMGEKERQKKRESLGVPPGRVVLLTSGEMIPRKNQEVLFRMLAKLKDSEKESVLSLERNETADEQEDAGTGRRVERCSYERLHLLLCGHGELKEYLQDLAAQLGIADHISFLGYREDMAEIFGASDIFLFPSFQEGLPRAMLEAMASGLPVVCSEIRGNTDLMGEEWTLSEDGSQKICPGGMMNMITTDLMDKSGITWPEAHLNAEIMADLAQANYENGCFENVGVPFCMTIEAESMGAKVTLGDRVHEPHVTEYALHSVKEWEKIRPMDMNYGRVKVVLDAIRILKSRNLDVPIIGNITGPVSTASSVMEPVIFYKELRKKKEDAHKYMELVADEIIRFARAQIDAGADIIAISDPSGTGEILGPKLFEEYAVHYINRIIDHLQAEKMGVIVHICGQMRNVYAQVEMIHSDVLSFDSCVAMSDAKKHLKKHVLMGNVSTWTLEFGNPEKVEQLAVKCWRDGSGIISPACGLGTKSPLTNIQAIRLGIRKATEEKVEV